MFIIKIEASPNGSRPPLQSWSNTVPPEGFAFLTDAQKDVFYSTVPAGFVNLTVEEQDGVSYVASIEVNQEALDAYKATLPDPTDSIKAEKIAEIKKDCEEYIYAGTSVTYTDSNTEHFRNIALVGKGVSKMFVSTICLSYASTNVNIIFTRLLDFGNLFSLDRISGVG